MELKTHISHEELKTYPIKHFEGPITVIDRLDQVSEAVDFLSRSKFLGFDTETRPVFKKGMVNNNPIALIQLSTEDRAFLFRINKMGMPIELKFLLEDPEVLKIGSAIKGDIERISKLEPDVKFYPEGFIDIQDIAGQMGIITVGLKKLSAILLGHTLSKKHQLTNWENDKLTPGQINYAATDAWTCYMLYKSIRGL